MNWNEILGTILMLGVSFCTGCLCYGWGKKVGYEEGVKLGELRLRAVVDALREGVIEEDKEK